MLQGANRRFPKGERKALWCARRRKPLPLAGIDAPTPARIGTGRPKGRSHFSFGGERKVCKRKPAARRLREKALYCPFLKEGVRNVARSMVERSTWTFVRARAHSFPLSKRARLFPSAAYRRSAPAQLAVGRLTPYGFRRFPEDRREPWHGRCHGDLCAMDTGTPTRIASREARSRAAVASQPSCMSPEHPCAPAARSPGCRAARGSACPVGTTAEGG